MRSGHLPARFGTDQSSPEDHKETLKCMVKAQRESRKKRFLEQVLTQQFQDDVDHGDDNLYLSGSNSIQTLPPVSCVQTLEDRETIIKSDQECDVHEPERHDPSLILSKRSKHNSTRRQAGQVQGTADESYDFFTFNFQPDPVCKEPLPECDKNNLVITASLSQDLLQVKKAQRVAYKKCIQKESELLFKPSSQSVPISMKLPENMKHCQVKENHLSVEQRPLISQANRNILENRMLKTNEGKKWFGDDGRVIALPDPIKKSSTRSPLLDMETDLNSEVQLVYRKACIPGSEELRANFQLNVGISGLVFSHHPLFSHEHILGARLTQRYELYLTRQHNNLTGHLTDKLKVMRKVVQYMCSSHRLSEANQQRISEYTLEIRKTRQLRDSEQEKDCTLLQNIIEMWKEIKALRCSQKYNSTTYQLDYRKLKVDHDKDKQEYEEEIMSEVLDLEREMEGEYRIKLLNYEIQVKEWDEWRNEHESKRSQKKEHDQNEDESETTLKRAPPVAPEKLALECIEKQVRKKASRIRRKPGKDILIPVLYTSGNITATKLCPPDEKNRRDKVAKLSYFIRVLCNNKEVSQTESCFLSSDFKLHFGVFFKTLKAANPPQSIHLHVFEGTELSCTLLAQVVIPVPQISVETGQVHLKELKFSSNNISMSVHNTEIHPTSGKLSCCAFWGNGEDGIPLAPPVARKQDGLHNYHNAVSHDSRSGKYDMNNLDQIAQSQLDPNDPINSSTMQQWVTKDGKVIKEYLHLEHLPEEFNFVNGEELERSKRFRMLQLRDQGIAQFRNCKCIPALEKEVTDEKFQEPDTGLEGEILDTTQYLDADQVLAAKHLLSMQKHIIGRFSCVKLYCFPSDMGVTEERPKILDLFKLVNFKRLLKPEEKQQQTNITTHNLPDGRIKVLVNVIRAYNIPVRCTRNNKTSFEDSKLFLNHMQVRPFVEVSLQHTVLQTCTAEGRNPIWNHHLQLPVSNPSLSDEIFINIFDEVEDVQRERSAQRQVDKHCLGFVKVPLSTIYSQSRIDGTFTVNTPAVLLGYRKENSQDRNDRLCSQGQETYITLSISIEPMLVPAKFIRANFESKEDEHLLQASKKFVKDAYMLYPERPCITTVIDLSGKEVFITRYIRPLNPPKPLLNEHSSNSQDAIVARYVSLIPSLPDRDYLGSCEILSRCDQFLTHLTGAKADHAVLLCNYFMFMKKKALLLIGSAIPEGQTAYVLTQEESQYLIWNPRNGQCYTQYDAFCPLQTVGSLISVDNIWLNIQKHTSPMRISFDNMKANLWKPFFSPSFVYPGLSGIQVDRLVYQQPDKVAAAELQRRIENTVKHKFVEWRPQQPTNWNHYYKNILGKFLPKLELSERQVTVKKHCHELQKLLGDMRISGHTLHQPFSGMQHIIKAVHRMGVQNIQAPNVQFALAVYVHPYPNNILSVWVYLASIIHM